MTWAKLDDQFFRHRRNIALSHKAIALKLACVCFCCGNLTDGKILTAEMPLVLAEARVTKATLRELIDNGDLVPLVDGWQVKDFLQWQRSRTEVIAEREKWAEKKRRQRGESPPMSPGDSPGESHGPSQPKPSQPKPAATTESLTTAAAALHGASEAAAAAISMLIEHKIAAGEANKPTAFRQKMPAHLHTEHGPALSAYLERKPDASARELAERVLGLSEIDLYRIGAA
jgi:hypothetical protein